MRGAGALSRPPFFRMLAFSEVQGLEPDMAHPLTTFLAAFCAMSALWPLSLKLSDVSIIDILWAPAFAILAFVDAGLRGGIGVHGAIVLALVTIWAVRLGSHIFLRWRRLGHEDYRYAAMRRKMGHSFAVKSLVTIFWLQAILLWIISWPLQAALDGAQNLNVPFFAGVAMTLAGIVVEGLADHQLTAFRATPAHKDRVLETGLWRWSRHPNYFGDFLVWWGFFVIAIAAGGPWWTVLGPVVMSALLMHYSGAGLMEDTISDRRPGYAAYVKRTNRFFPGPNRR